MNQQRVHFGLGRKPEADALVKRFHYSHRAPNALVLGHWALEGWLFGDTGELVAACYFASPTTSGWSEPVLELIRLVRAEDIDIPPLTGLIAQTVQWVKRKGLADLLISYADSTQDHHGGIYQAASWHYDGKRSPSNDGVIINGQFVPGRSAVSQFGTRSVAKLAEKGIVAEGHFDAGKHLYWRALDRNGMKRAERLGLRNQPYPKPASPPA